MEERAEENGERWWSTNKTLHVCHISNSASNKPLYRLTVISEKLALSIILKNFYFPTNYWITI